MYKLTVDPNLTDEAQYLELTEKGDCGHDGSAAP